MSLPDLTGLAEIITDYELTKRSFNRVDGLIIGTGHSDFTKANIRYDLECQGKTFSLIDVPGIEGDESHFTRMVQEAVAKAHLVLYVNGTNKKPERTTAEKIKSYLRRGSNVCTLVNVRGGAGNYEFKEDRESVDKQGLEILKQTEAVLSAVLEERMLLPGHCVQGLIAFCSLANDSISGTTTIHPNRDSDLARQQRNYLKYFESYDAMYRFSQIERVEDVVRKKLSTYKEDIIESNKEKLRKLLEDNILILETLLKTHKEFLSKIEPEFQRCKSNIKEDVNSFERLLRASHRNVYNELFDKLIEDSETIIEKNFGETEFIALSIAQAFERHSQEANIRLEESIKECLSELGSRIEEKVNRLLEDIDRTQLQFTVKQSEGWLFEHTGKLGWNLTWKDFGSAAFQIGSYAASGAAIGSLFPGYGTVIGAIVGSAIGLVMTVLNLFMSKAKRIRKCQAEVCKKIEAEREKKLNELAGDINNILVDVRRHINEGVMHKLEILEKNLFAPTAIISKQISCLTNLKNNLEAMPYGSIKAV